MANWEHLPSTFHPVARLCLLWGWGRLSFRDLTCTGALHKALDRVLYSFFCLLMCYYYYFFKWHLWTFKRQASQNTHLPLSTTTVRSRQSGFLPWILHLRELSYVFSLAVPFATKLEFQRAKGSPSTGAYISSTHRSGCSWLKWPWVLPSGLYYPQPKGLGWADLRGPAGTFTLWPDYARRSPW